MDCSGECWELGPPPDSILRMPPPPLPAFLQLSRGGRDSSNLTGGACRPAELCDPPAPGVAQDPGVEYIELPHHDPSSADDTWFLVLITSCIAVVFLGIMLAFFLLKCRDESGAGKQAEGALAAELAGPLQAKGAYSSGPAPPGDNRALWAALTPRGTQHFLADMYPHPHPHPQDHCRPMQLNTADHYPDDNHYETVEAMNYKAALHPYQVQMMQVQIGPKVPDKSSFDNSAFVDYEYEEPAPLIESYQMDDMETCYQEPDLNPYCVVSQYSRGQDRHDQDMSMKRGVSRPLVSSPTRIENPNLPPLNLYPHRTLRKSSHSRRVSDTNSYNGNINI